MIQETLFSEQLAQIAAKGNLRALPSVSHRGEQIATSMSEEMLNLSSNDYLGLASNPAFAAPFWESFDPAKGLLSASSSRLLTGNFEIYTQLEQRLSQLYGTQEALVLNSGYHANTGILPAITTSHSLILADKLVHASLIDGIRLSSAKNIRYRHNDYQQLERLLESNAHLHDRVVVVTESIFSMDGDRADLLALIALKRRYPNLLLYLDEAHAVGAIGSAGLGCAHQMGVAADIDLLVGTFGKALASVGAFLLCTTALKEWLVNTMRTLIFTTALPPINLYWSLYVLDHLAQLAPQREHLAQISTYLATQLGGGSLISQSHIVPVIAGESKNAVKMALALQRKGFYVLPVRPPTVPEGSSRLRISLTASITQEQVESVVEALSIYNSNYITKI